MIPIHIQFGKLKYFEYLNKYYPQLAKLGSTAECYLYSDPNACIYKLGLLSETIVNAVFDIEKLKELAEKIKYYLSHPEEAQSIIDKGFEIVSKEDTWKERLKTILFM